MLLTHNLTHTSANTKSSKRLTRALPLVAFFALMLLTPKAANAETITLTIDPMSLAATPGSTVTFIGRITNLTGGTLNASDMFLNFGGFDPTFTTPVQLLGDPDFVLPDRTISASVNLFTITVAPLTPPGTYSIELFLQDIDNNFSNAVTVSVIVGAAAIPEPTTILLFITGLASAGITRHKRRNNRRR